MSLKDVAKKALKTGQKVQRVAVDDRVITKAIKDPSLKNLGMAALEVGSLTPAGKAAKVGLKGAKLAKVARAGSLGNPSWRVKKGLKRSADYRPLVEAAKKRTIRENLTPLGERGKWTT